MEYDNLKRVYDLVMGCFFTSCMLTLSGLAGLAYLSEHRYSQLLTLSAISNLGQLLSLIILARVLPSWIFNENNILAISNHLSVRQ